jgi:hypothetical protein
MTANENRDFSAAKKVALKELDKVKLQDKGINFFNSNSIMEDVKDKVKKAKDMDELKFALEDAMTVTAGINGVWKKVFPNEAPKLYSIALMYDSDSE